MTGSTGPFVPSPIDLRLILRAAKAATFAHAPYSEYSVGAALLAEKGRIVTGCNVENASYGLTLCAERAAIASAVSLGLRRFRKIAIVGGKNQPAYPCGACLQVLAEFCGPELELILSTGERRQSPMRFALKDLFPCAFKL